MRWVGEHYQSGKYFISGLIMAGEIFREAMVDPGPAAAARDTADAGAGQRAHRARSAATSTTSARTSSS